MYKVEKVDEELLDQEDIIEIRIKQLEKERDEALRHVVGMAYWNEIAQEKNEQIKKLKKG